MVKVKRVLGADEDDSGVRIAVAREVGVAQVGALCACQPGKVFVSEQDIAYR
jgi:hypothetical protein